MRAFRGAPEVFPGRLRWVLAIRAAPIEGEKGEEMRAREHLNSILRQVESMQTWSDHELEVIGARLQSIDVSFPSAGDLVCKNCSERLVIDFQASVQTRDSGNTHCSRSSGGHVPEFVDSVC